MHNSDKQVDKEYFYRRIFTGITISSGLLFSILINGWISYSIAINTNFAFIVLTLSFLGVISSYIYGCILVYIRHKTRKQQRRYTSGFGGRIALVLSCLIQGIATFFLAIMIFFLLYPGPK